MKKIITQLAIFTLLLVLFAACDKDENKITFEGGTAPVLTASRADSIPLSFVDQADEAISFSWTNPNYRFTTGISSQDVLYTIEIDTAGADFSSAKKKSESISRDLAKTFTQSQFNDFLLNDLQFAPGAQHSIEIRLKASLASGAGVLYSNTMRYLVTPYAIPPKVTPPGTAPDFLDGRLFMVGSATVGGWNNPVPEPEQEFTKISPTMYELILPMTGGASYLWLPENGSWSRKYGAIGANNTNNPLGDDFREGGGDFLAPAVSGIYKIVVDFQRGKYTVTLQ